MTAKRYRFVSPGGGPNYDWTRDHTFVKVAAADTGGAYALMEDNLKWEFALGLHVHRQHAETFYILDGEVNFHIDGDWMTAKPACRTRSTCRRAAPDAC
jgi:mannose-6-phosphate isomerase-like protein (cupin superfamily)